MASGTWLPRDKLRERSSGIGKSGDVALALARFSSLNLLAFSHFRASTVLRAPLMVRARKGGLNDLMDFNRLLRTYKVHVPRDVSGGPFTGQWAAFKDFVWSISNKIQSDFLFKKPHFLQSRFGRKKLGSFETPVGSEYVSNLHSSFPEIF